MTHLLDKLFVIKRKTAIQVLFYCPACESINELEERHMLDRLVCHDCLAELNGQHAVLEAINPPPEEQ